MCVVNSLGLPAAAAAALRRNPEIIDHFCDEEDDVSPPEPLQMRIRRAGLVDREMCAALLLRSNAPSF